MLCLTIVVQSKASVVIKNGLTHMHTAKAGEAVKGIIEVKNDGVTDSRILIYRQDLTYPCGGSANYQEVGSHTGSLGNLLKTNIDDRPLAGNEQYNVVYDIAIPANQTSGTYWEVIMIEVANPIREEFSGGVQVNSKIRYAIQVIVAVGNYEGPKLTFEDMAFRKTPEGIPLVAATIRNNGIFGARASVILEVYDGSGNKIKVTPPQSRMMYPGNCNVYEIPINELPKGKFDGVIVADTGKDLFGSNITIENH